MFKFLQRRAITPESAGALIGNLFSTKRTVTVSAEQISTVYRSIKLISDSIASTRLKHFEATDKGQEELTGSNLSRLFKKPNSFNTFNELMSSAMVDLLGQGNGYIQIIRNDNGIPIELVNIAYFDVQIVETLQELSPWYYLIKGVEKVFPENMIHIKNTWKYAQTNQSKYRILGISPITAHMLTLQTAGDLQDYVRNFLENSTHLTGVLETDSKLNKDSIEELRKNFSRKFGSAKNAGKTPVLTNGLKYNQLKVISPMDADYIANKKMNQEEICQVFGVPPSMLGIGEQKYSDAEQQNLVFQNYTINPILDNIQEEFTFKLIPNWRPKEFIEFKPQPLRMASSKEKAETLSLLRNSSILTPNEARVYYDLPKLTDEVATKLKDTVSETNNVGDNVQEPKNTDDTNPDKSEPVTDAQVAKTVSTIRAELQELREEMHKVKTDNGRLRKELKEQVNVV